MSLPPPSQVAELTPAWLTAALRESGVLDVAEAAEVVAVQVTVIGEELGFTGLVARLKPSYRPAGAGPESIVAKLPTAERRVDSSYRRRLAAEPDARRVLAQRAAREIAFYRDTATGGPAPVPQMLYGAVDDERHDVVLLLEDVGDGRQADLFGGMSADEARAVLQAMARLHGHWWARTAAGVGWLPEWGSDPRARGERYARQADLFLERYATALPAGAVAIVQRLKADYEPVLRRLAAAPRTVIHGDLHADNVLLRDGPAGRPAAIVLDWQTVSAGPAAVDLATLLVGSMTIATRRAHEHNLLAEYWARLSESGVAGFSLDDLWRDYREATLWLLCGTVGWLASVDPSTLAGRERLMVERLVSEPRVFQAAVDQAR